MVGIVGDYHELLLVLLLYVRQLVWRGSSQPTDHDRPTDRPSAFRSDDPEPNFNHTDYPDCESKLEGKKDLVSGAFVSSSLMFFRGLFLPRAVLRIEGERSQCIARIKRLPIV
jgi:hypothetical protein